MTSETSETSGHKDQATVGVVDEDRGVVEPVAGASQPRIHVVRYRPGLWFWWCFPFIVAGAVWVGYYLGLGSLPQPDRALQTAALQERYDVQRMTEMREELTTLKMTQMVDGGAAQEAQQNFRVLQDDIAALEEEVAFYRSLMAPEDLARGLHIEKVILRETARELTFGYELVVAQAVARHLWQEGELYFEIHGARDSAREVLALTEIATIPAYPLLYKFRYFQNFSGELTLPADFVPERVIVTLDRGGSEELVQEIYEWIVQKA